MSECKLKKILESNQAITQTGREREKNSQSGVPVNIPETRNIYLFNTPVAVLVRFEAVFPTVDVVLPTAEVALPAVLLTVDAVFPSVFPTFPTALLTFPTD